MPMGSSRYLNIAWLNTLRGVSFTPPSTVFVALYSALPDKDDSGGVELTGGGYERLEVDFSTGFADGNDDDVIENTEELLFPLAAANWDTIVGAAIRDASTGGNLLYFGELEAPRTVNTGDRLRFSEGDLRLGIGKCQV